MNPPPSSTSASATACAPTFELTVLDTGERYGCRADESALHALARSGRRGIPAGCHGGGCGVCKVAVESGAYDRTRPMSRSHVSAEDEAQHRVLACCIRPHSDLSLRVIGQMRKSVCRTPQR